MRVLNILMLAFLLLCPAPTARAAAQDDYDTASLQYVAALVSLASYSDRAGVTAREELAQAGWAMRPHSNRFDDLETRFFVVSNRALLPGKEVYILAVAGTENVSDLKTDLNFSKVFFGGATPAAFAEAAARGDLTSKDPMVHRGFHQYAQTAFFSPEADGETYGEYLVRFLAEKDDRILYMTGHSLGGAVATLGAARLLQLGADPERVRVLTFGAPAVGNAAFARQYGASLRLSRIVIRDDPVKGLLQSISGGYAQFGASIVWEERVDVYRRAHSIGVYADAALRNYYDVRDALVRAGGDGAADTLREAGAAMVYIAPPRLEIAAALAGDARYIGAAVQDSIRAGLPSGFVVGASSDGSLRGALAAARADGCAWLLRPFVKVERDRQRRGEFYVAYQEEIYDARSGELKSVAAHSQGTRVFTPIQAAMNDAAGVREQRLQTLAAQQGGA